MKGVWKVPGVPFTSLVRGPLRVLLRTFLLLGKKVASIASGLFGSGVAGACDVDRSLCGDILLSPSWL